MLTLTCAMGRIDLDAKASMSTPIIAPAKTTKIGESSEYESVGEINSLIYLPPCVGAGSVNPIWETTCAAAGLMMFSAGAG